jgi:hypothetical protein
MNKNILRGLVCTVALAGLVSIATPTHAALKFYNVTLNGANEAPPNASLGTGVGLVTIDTTLSLMTVTVNFSGLTGTVTNSHIHAATTTAFTGTAGVATQTPTFFGFPSGVTAGTYTNTFNMLDTASYNPAYVTANGGNVTTAFGALLSAMDGGKAYWNIHTTSVPAGEIRGFLVAAPEPTTLSLLALGGMGVFLRRRKSTIN